MMHDERCPENTSDERIPERGEVSRSVWLTLTVCVEDVRGDLRDSDETILESAKDTIDKLDNDTLAQMLCDATMLDVKMEGWE